MRKDSVQMIDSISNQTHALREIESMTRSIANQYENMKLGSRLPQGLGEMGLRQALQRNRLPNISQITGFQTCAAAAAESLIQHQSRWLSAVQLVTKQIPLDMLTNQTGIGSVLADLRILTPVFEVARSIGKWHKDILGSPSMLHDLVPSMAASYRFLQGTNIELHPDGTLTIGNNVISIDEVRDRVHDDVENSGVVEASSFSEARQGIIALVRQWAEDMPILIWLIVYLIVPQMNNLITPYVQQGITRSYRAVRPEITREVRRSVAASPLPPVLYSHLRFVSADLLNVRAKSNTKSRVIGTLELGAVVQILHKKRGWALVRYEGPDGEIMLQGWVSLRYIKRFN